jgi:predicted MFS family arabinose efflux permease
VILLTGNFYVLLLIGFALGIAKGIRKVYMWLVIPDYVSLEKLASASGMDMLARGACILIGGTVLGAVRGATGNYRMCIILMNCVTIATIVMWTAEYFIVKYKRKNCVVRSNNIQLK